MPATYGVYRLLGGRPLQTHSLPHFFTAVQKYPPKLRKMMAYPMVN